MKIIGLTGGIGAGKSTISKIFTDNGIPVYNSDNKAREIMNKNIDLKNKIILSFGKQSYQNEKLNKAYISKIIFDNKLELNKINSLVHPFVQDDFYKWIKKTPSKYIIYESALIFETGSYKKNDFNILVISDLDKKIERVCKRDNLSKIQVLKRINNQWDDDKKMSLCDYKIFNNSLNESKTQTLKIIEIFNNMFH